MIDPIKKAIRKIEKLSKSKQEEMAILIEDELSWDTTFAQSQEKLSILAKEALGEYKDGKAKEQDW